MSELASITSRQQLDTGAAATRAVLPPLVVIVAAFAIHALGNAFGDYPTRVMIECGIAIIASVSLTMVNGFTGQFSIGHAAFIALGGYTSGFLTYYFMLSRGGDPASVTPTLFGSMQWTTAVACVAAGLVSAGVGWLVGLPSLRLRGDYLAIVTLGFGEIVRVMLQQTGTQIDNAGKFATVGWSGALFPPATGGSLGFANVPKTTNLLWTFLFVGACLLFAYRLKYSSLGRSMLSIREDEIAAEAMGVNVTKLKVRAFIFAAFFAGVAGSLYAHLLGVTMTPQDAGFQRSFDIVMMVVLGGLGSISGAAIAAIVITVLNALMLYLAQYNMLQYRLPAFALMLIVMIIFRPQGLLGLREVWDWFPKSRRRRDPLGGRHGFDVGARP